MIYGPGRETTYTVEEIVSAALAGTAARVAPMGDWPYVYIDDAARAAAQACYANGRKQLQLLHRPSGKVTPDDIAAAAAAAGKPVRIGIDASRPRAERGPLDIEPAARDFGFRAQVGHREGIRRLIEAAR